MSFKVGDIVRLQPYAFVSEHKSFLRNFCGFVVEESMGSFHGNHAVIVQFFDQQGTRLLFWNHALEHMENNNVT